MKIERGRLRKHSGGNIMKLALRNGNKLLPFEDDFESLFEEFFRPSLLIRESNLIPSIEITEDEKNYYLKAVIPGVNKEDLDIQLQEDYVSVIGETKSQNQENCKSVCRSELRYGKFSRNVQLPGKIDNKKAKAEYENGILSLTLPKCEEDRNKVVRLKLN